MPAKAEDGATNLEWRDYVALFLAMLQTIALPLIFLILIILAALFLLRLL